MQHGSNVGDHGPYRVYNAIKQVGGTLYDPVGDFVSLDHALAHLRAEFGQGSFRICDSIGTQWDYDRATDEIVCEDVLTG